MQKRFLNTLFFVLLASFYTNAQSVNSATKQYFDLVRPVFLGENAFQTTAYVEKFWRVAGNSGFDSSIYYVEDILKKAGYIAESEAKKTDRLVYRIETRKMNKPTWEPISGIVKLEGDDLPLLDFASNKNMLCINSHSTAEGGVKVEIVSADSENIKGKIVYANEHPYRAWKKALLGGAVGVISYRMPDYTQPEKHQSSIQFSSIPVSKNQLFGIMLSYQAKVRLENALAKGNVFANVNIQTKIYEAEELTLIAQVRGKQLPKEELVISAHVQEPGANDNASGVGVLAEIAQSTALLLKEEKINPKRTLTFLWGDEIISTKRYVKKYGSQVKWGMSLDMVGENTELTGGSFLIEKMPDPSAIWTRGNDKHTEWGAGNISESDLFPHFLNDFTLNRCLEQASATGWKVNVNPFEGGSDHTPFLDAKKPAVLFWHFTDVFYHTDNDRIDKVSKATLKNVGASTWVTALALAEGKEKLALQTVEELEKAFKARLQIEKELSVEAIAKNNSSSAKETQIIKAWASWYYKALQTIKEIPIEKSDELNKRIEAVSLEIIALEQEALKAIQG